MKGPLWGEFCPRRCRDKNSPGFRARKKQSNFLFRQLRIERYDHRTERHRGKVGEDPLRTVFRKEGQPVLFCYSSLG